MGSGDEHTEHKDQGSGTRWDAGRRRVFWFGILSAVAEVWTLYALRALYLVVTSQLHIFHFLAKCCSESSLAPSRIGRIQHGLGHAVGVNNAHNKSLLSLSTFEIRASTSRTLGKA